MVSSLPQTVPIFGSHLPGIHQRLNEIRQQQHVRIQGQHPVAAGERDGLVLRGGEADVFLVVDDLAAVLELFQDIDGAVGRVVIDDDDFLVAVSLLEHRFQASLDESAAIVSYDGDGYEVAIGHELEPELTLLSPDFREKTTL